jgi:hypothetical protein
MLETETRTLCVGDVVAAHGIPMYQHFSGVPTVLTRITQTYFMGVIGGVELAFEEARTFEFKEGDTVIVVEFDFPGRNTDFFPEWANMQKVKIYSVGRDPENGKPRYWGKFLSRESGSEILLPFYNAHPVTVSEESIIKHYPSQVQTHEKEKEVTSEIITEQTDRIDLSAPIGNVSQFFRTEGSRYLISSTLFNPTQENTEVDTNYSVFSKFCREDNGYTVGRLVYEVHTAHSMAEATRTSRNKEQADYKHNWDVLTQALYNEAEKRGWCSEYEEFCDSIAGELRMGWELVHREQDFDIDVDITVDGRVVTTESISITARTKEDAMEMFNDDPSSFIDPVEVLLEAIRYGSVDVECELS